MGFTTLDYGVLFIYLLATAVFGVWLGRGQKNLKDYFLAGKNMPWWAICFSIVATETSTLTFIGAPALAYEGNLTFFQVALGYILGKLLVSLILIPLYFKGEISSAYEVLNFRFGAKVKNFSALIFQGNRMLADGVRLWATALVLSVVTELTSVQTVIIIGLITILYTFYGGMIAVVWNDVIQLLIYLGGAALAAYLLLEQIPGGWGAVVAGLSPAEKFQMLDFSFSWANPYTLAAGLIGGAFLTFATHGTDQMMVQRYLSCRSRAQSQAALMVSGVVVLLQFMLFLLIGVLLFAFYRHFPMSREITGADEVFPIFIVEQMPAGVSGLIIAATFAAAMSTLSSSLNSLSSSSVNDFYRPYFAPRASDAHYLRASRFFTLIWGLILIGVSMLARNWGGVLEAGLTITSIVMGSVLGIFLLGQWTRLESQAAALTAMGSGLLAMILVHFTLELGWTWYVLVGTSVTFGTGLFAQSVVKSR